MRNKIWAVLLLTVSIALVVLMVGCASSAPVEEKKAYGDGDFKGVSEDGTVEVSLTIGDGKIESVQIVEFDKEGNQKDIETYLVCVGDDRVPLLSEAHPTLAKRIIEQNTWDIDIFTGATGSSNKIREAAKKALEAAKK